VRFAAGGPAIILFRRLQQLRVATSPSGRLDAFVLGFGQDPAGEMYVLTSERPGPSGTTGRVFKLVRPSG